MKNVCHSSVLVNEKQKCYQSKAKGKASHFTIVFTDVDECFQGTHSCSAYAVCNNTNGSYNCRCKANYTGDGQNCTRLGENRLVLLRLRPLSLNGNDYDSNVDCKSSCDNGNSDGNSVDNKSMDPTMMTKGSMMITFTTVIVEGLTLLRIMRAMSISWLMLT